MKKCPFCAEDVQDAAVKCKHCGSDLAGNLTAQAMANKTYVTNPKSGKKKMLAGIGLMFFGFVIGGAVNGAAGVFIAVVSITFGIGLIIYGKLQHWFHWE